MTEHAKRTSDGSGLLERTDELARLKELAAAATNRRGAVAVVEGPPGIGKTALLRALGERAEEVGLDVLRARGVELEQPFAFGVVRQLFEVPVASVPERERPQLLSGAASLAAPLVDPAEPGDRASRSPADPFPLLHGLYWLTANLAERAPLAIVVDDAHWADGPSLRWLHYLSSRLDGVSALVALAVRSTEPEAPVESIEAIKVEQATALLRLTPLSEPASAALLGELLGSAPAPELVSEAHRAANGNPFLLCELGRSLAADGVAPSAAAAMNVKRATPETIARSAFTRLARLPADARALARATALLGEDAELRHAAVLAGLGELEALEATDRLAAAGFLDAHAPSTATPQLRFTHPVIRQALYADLPPGERASRHKEAARLLLAETGSTERAAPHLINSAPAADAWVVEALRRAAAGAAASGAPDIAVSYLRRALAEPPSPDDRPEVLFELGSVEAVTEGPVAVENLSAALELTEEPSRRAIIATRLARTLILVERGGDAAKVAGEAIEGLGEHDVELRGRLEALAVAAMTTDPARAEAGDQLVARARKSNLAVGDDFGAKALAGALAYLDAQAGVPAVDVVPSAQRALEGEVLLAEDNGGIHFLGAVLVLEMADSDLALPTLAAGLELAGRRGDLVAWGTDNVFTCLAHLVRGELAPAVTAGEDGVAASDAHGIAAARPWASGCLAAAQVERGDLGGAERTLGWAGATKEVAWHAYWLPFLDARARLRMARRELRAALEDSLRCGHLSAALGRRNPALVPWRSRAALCLTELGDDVERAHALAAEEVGLARTWGAPRALGVALRAQGLATGGTGGIELLREAVEILDGSPARLEHARALCELGAALRRANRRAEARGALERAIEVARACGAFPLVERAHAELRATGARPRSLVFTGVDSLTARERQVAELAAEGRANPEIAQALFVTRKTVETHLGSVYRKLELDSRKQLAEALAAEPK